MIIGYASRLKYSLAPDELAKDLLVKRNILYSRISHDK